VNSGAVAIAADPVRKLYVPTIAGDTDLRESLSRLSKSLL